MGKLGGNSGGNRTVEVVSVSPEDEITPPCGMEGDIMYMVSLFTIVCRCIVFESAIEDTEEDYLRMHTLFGYRI